MARKRPSLTDLLNDLTCKTIFDKFKMIATNAFEWENLPDGILPRHIETVLFDKGMVCFFRANNMGYMALPVDNGVGMNVYGDPLTYNVHGINYHDTLDADDCVIIENNLLRKPTFDFVLFYANKLTEAERTMDVNVKANKTPVIMLCDEHDVLSFKRIFQQTDGNVPAIFADKSLSMDAIQALDTKAKFLCGELMDYKHSVEAELLTFLGINNPAVDKKERLITDEANSNNQLIGSFMQLQLEARERAAAAINEKFGLHITVKRRDEADEEVSDDVVSLVE